jgi:hypothetical protein
MSARIVIACPKCGEALERHKRKNHLRLHCPKNGALAKEPRKCRYRGCPTMFAPKPGCPQQQYCHPTCWNKEQAAKRKERYDAALLAGTGEGAAHEPPTQEERNEKELAPLARKAVVLEAEAMTHVPVMGQALVEMTLRLMRVA